MTFAMRTKKLIFLSMAMLISCFCKANSCIESERIALLQFKQALNDPGNRLSSWVGNDCCIWAGVICHNSTAHVRQLRLRNSFNYYYEREAYLRNALGGELSSSLLNLKHLDHLDLSGNKFQGIPIPNFIGSLENLVYLNLSVAGFGGVIPYQLGNLTRMRFLGLRSYHDLSAYNLGWLSGLALLKYLDMSGTDLRKALDWLQVLNFRALIILALWATGFADLRSHLAADKMRHQKM